MRVPRQTHTLAEALECPRQQLLTACRPQTLESVDADDAILVHKRACCLITPSDGGHVQLLLKISHLHGHVFYMVDGGVDRCLMHVLMFATNVSDFS